MIDIALTGYDDIELKTILPACEFVASALFSKIGKPALTSKTLAVISARAMQAPMYTRIYEQETIFTNSSYDSPWQFSYQLAHELAHLSADAMARYPRNDGLLWVEEALCECHSVIAIKKMANTQGALKSGAEDYQSLLMAKYNDQVVNSSWFIANESALSQAGGLTQEAFYISRYILNDVNDDDIIRDNRLLALVPTNQPRKDFLNQWDYLSSSPNSVPKTLLKLMI